MVIFLMLNEFFPILINILTEDDIFIGFDLTSSFNMT